MKKYVFPGLIAFVLLAVTIVSFSVKASPASRQDFTEYEVVEGRTLADLSRAVTAEMRVGWQPAGGLSEASAHWVQAMVR